MNPDSSYLITNREMLDILSLSPNATAIYTSEKIIIQMANDKMIGFWGKDRSIIGMSMEEAIPELKGQPFIGLLQNVWNTGITYEAKDAAAELPKNGRMQTLYFDFVYKALKNEAGNVYCILHTATDVTEQYLSRQAFKESKLREEVLNEQLAFSIEEVAVMTQELITANDDLNQSYKSSQILNMQLANSEARARYMLSDAPVAIAVLTGRELIIESANHKILDIWGKDKSVIGKQLHLAIPELDSQSFLETLDQVFLSGQPLYGNEVKAFFEKNNELEEAWFNFVFQPLKGPAGYTINIMIVATEVTEQINSRKKIEQAEEMLRMATDSGDLGTWYINAETRELIASPRLKQIFGFKPKEEMPYDAAVIQIDKEYREKVTSAIEASIKKGEKFDLEYPVTGFHDQKLRWVRSTGKLNLDSQDRPSHLTGISHDITESKLDELRKNDFIAMVSHELKTPLTSLKAYVQMLMAREKKNQDTFTTEALGKVNNQVKKMTDMINGFLNLSRLESGKIQLNKTDFRLDEMIKESVEEIDFTTSSHDLIYLPCEPVMIHGDFEKLVQVINNLLSNAIKYSPKKRRIEITCYGKNEMAVVSVKDEGMGINIQDINNLFDRFYRVASNHTQTISGFGIGLYICAEIIHRHNGKIWVESEIGKGSTFFFTLPLA